MARLFGANRLLSGRRFDHSGHRSERPTLTLAIVSGCVLLALLVALTALAAGCSNNAAAGPITTTVSAANASANTVTVTGTATVTSPPDEAAIELTVENDATTATAAMDATSVQSNQLLASLKALGIDQSAIQTSNVTLYPVRNYEPNTGKETLTGYRAQNTVKVTLKDAPTVAKVLAAGVEAGVTTVTGPDWRLRDDSQAVNDALKQAVAHARSKADTLATAGGVSLGAVVSMTEGSVQVPVPIYDAAGAAASDSKVSEPAVTSGTLDVTATVTITYALKR